MKRFHPRNFAYLPGYQPTHLLVLPVKMMPSFPHQVTSNPPVVNNHLQSRAPSIAGHHRHQYKGCSSSASRQLQQPCATVAEYKFLMSSKKGIEIANRTWYAYRVHCQANRMFQRICGMQNMECYLFERLISAIPSDFHALILMLLPPKEFINAYPVILNRFSDEELLFYESKKEVLEILASYKKALRICSDMLRNYFSLIMNNDHILLKGLPATAADVPDDVLIGPVHVYLSEEHEPVIEMFENLPISTSEKRKNRRRWEKKQTIQRRKARRNKTVEHNAFYNNWCIPENTAITAEAENAGDFQNVSVAEKAVFMCENNMNQFLEDPQLIEAFDLTDFYDAMFKG